jgi:hypothetical protein
MLNQLSLFGTGSVHNAINKNDLDTNRLDAYQNQVLSDILFKAESASFNYEKPCEHASWADYTQNTILSHIPRLLMNINDVVSKLEHKLNWSLIHLEELKALRNSCASPVDSKRLDTIIRSFSENQNEELITSQLVSDRLQNILVDDIFHNTCVNKPSSYPDIFINKEYSQLPLKNSDCALDVPNISKNGYPNNIPDGLEIKTCSGNQFRIDAHGNHAGLHLGCLWVKEDSFKVKNMFLNFITETDYIKGNNNSKNTTIKFSLAEKNFHVVY